MSADNWAICPKCNPPKRLADERSKLESLYGKISLEDFQTRQAALQLKGSALQCEGDSSLREDFHIGTSEQGVFEISYGCSCSRCGFEFSFKHKEKII